MGTDTPVDLFAHAGVELPVPIDSAIYSMQTRAPVRAASGRLRGARRYRSMPRFRVGPPRSNSIAEVFPFPLVRNAAAIAKVVEALPHGYSPELNKRRDQELYKLRDKLASNGICKADAWLCARQVVHAAYIERVTQAHKEAGVL